jgi:hypothetical protein
MGGRTPDTAFALIQEFDPMANTWARRTNIWSTNPRVSVPLFGFGANEVNGRIYVIGGASEITVEQGLSQVLEYTPPVIAPALQLNVATISDVHVLRLEWPSHSDYLDLLQMQNQFNAGDWIDVQTFSGISGTLSKELPPPNGPAGFYRLQRALK